ncbi:MAG: hypothetical protein JWO87_403 [Phycisphaerales bacterium]|nr:hypothetical protein [Phycisphaerales bacterium]
MRDRQTIPITNHPTIHSTIAAAALIASARGHRRLGFDGSVLMKNYIIGSTAAGQSA